GDEGDDPGGAGGGHRGQGAAAGAGAAAQRRVRRRDRAGGAAPGRAVRPAAGGQQQGRRAVRPAGEPPRAGYGSGQGPDVMNAQTVALLQGIVRRESLSMLTYVGEAFPWTTARDAESLARLRQIVVANNEAVAALGRYLTRHRQPLTFLGS